ncbi:hypothetical protein EGM51_09845 [Verrucomicrobia bacterium S94]|nr:hypothetical protein EGM51_09845 [Verrucomicrobia bacterium S94]
MLKRLKIKAPYIILIIFVIGVIFTLSKFIVWETSYPETDFAKDPFLERNPVELAIEHHQTAHKIKWLGYDGYTVYFPGVPDEILKESDRTERHRIIGTSDKLCGSKHEQYNIQAQEFAEIYNKKRLELNKQANQNMEPTVKTPVD